QELIDPCNRRGADAVGLLARYFAKFVLPQPPEKEVLDDFAGFFHTFFPAGAEYQDYSCRLVCWLRVVEACPEALLAEYQRYYLENHVPAEFRWRLAEEAYRLGKILTPVYERDLKPTEAAEPTAAPGALVANSVVFQLTGVSPAEDGSAAGQLWKRFLALLPAIAAGILALVLCGLFKDRLRNRILFVLFLHLFCAFDTGM